MVHVFYLVVGRGCSPGAHAARRAQPRCHSRPHAWVILLPVLALVLPVCAHANTRPSMVQTWYKHLVPAPRCVPAAPLHVQPYVASLSALTGLRRLDVYDTGGHLKLTQQLLEVRRFLVGIIHIRISYNVWRLDVYDTGGHLKLTQQLLEVRGCLACIIHYMIECLAAGRVRGLGGLLHWGASCRPALAGVHVHVRTHARTRTQCVRTCTWTHQHTRMCAPCSAGPGTLVPSAAGSVLRGRHLRQQPQARARVPGHGTLLLLWHAAGVPLTPCPTASALCHKHKTPQCFP